jgi:hypothetical protein
VCGMWCVDTHNPGHSQTRISLPHPTCHIFLPYCHPWYRAALCLDPCLILLYPHPHISRWTPEEHRLFLEGIMLYGKVCYLLYIILSTMILIVILIPLLTLIVILISLLVCMLYYLFHYLYACYTTYFSLI